MTINSILDAAGQDIRTKIGEEATFTPYGGSPYSVLVIFHSNLKLQPEGYDGAVVAEVKTIDILKSDLSSDPKKRDTIVIGATTYTVNEKILDDGTWVKVAVL
jgi:hypothetical protein